MYKFCLIDSESILQWLLSHGVRILIIIGGGFVVNFLLKRFIVKIVRLTVTADHHQSVEAEEKREETLIRVFTWSILLMIVIMASMMILQEIGIPIGPMLAGAGILGLAIGFGGQYLIRDYITGFLIIFENQYRIGDIVRLDATEGMVEDISLRMTTLRDLDGTVHHVPHGDIKRVSNLSKYFSRINMNINVSYQADLDKVVLVINRVGNELAADPQWKEDINKAPRFFRVEDFTDTAVTIKVVGETIPNRQWDVGGEFRKRIKDAFDQEGIYMPIVQRIVQQVSDTGKSNTPS
jgi:moderate conductance mechanosensitive channel